MPVGVESSLAKELTAFHRNGQPPLNNGHGGRTSEKPLHPGEVKPWLSLDWDYLFPQMASVNLMEGGVTIENEGSKIEPNTGNYKALIEDQMAASSWVVLGS